MSSSEDQMEMMLMSPDFYLPDYHDVVSSSLHHEFATANATSTSAVPAPPPFMSLPNSNISFSSSNNYSPDDVTQSSLSDDHHHKKNSMAAMKETMFRIAALQPINIDPESVKPPKRRNVKVSQDPQSVAARHRRERISERIRILRRLVPGGTKMDTASMLDEAVHYVKFLKDQVQSLERVASVNNNNKSISANSLVNHGIGFPVAMSNGRYLNHQYHPPPPLPPDHHPHHQGVQHYEGA